MGSDQTEIPTEAAEQTEAADQPQSDGAQHAQPTSPTSIPGPTVRASPFDTLAFVIIIIIAVSFALTARLNAQPPSSLVPAAVLSATGCGLLVTALRKLRTAQQPGLLLAGLAGFILALVQFIAAISYPGVPTILSTDEGQRLGFLATWGLVGAFSIIFAVAGAALGHLAFAPLRPLPAPPRATTRVPTPTPAPTEHSTTRIETITDHSAVKVETPRRSFVNYLITVLLLGLAPTLVGIVFSAAFDYMLGVYQFTPGPYPTSRLLSAMLPWQIPIDLHLDVSSASGLSSIVLLLWRIPAFVGNPTMFDVQALEPLIFNGAALGLLLLTMHRRDVGTRATTRVPTLPPTTPAPTDKGTFPDEDGGFQGLLLSWPANLVLEVVLGLLLVLPTNLWMLQGLQGLLQIPSLDVIVPIRVLTILDQRTFVLNLITGPVVCLGMGLLLRESKPWRTA